MRHPTHDSKGRPITNRSWEEHLKHRKEVRDFKLLRLLKSKKI
jgi:hypothetical protein